MARGTGAWLFIDTHTPGESRFAWLEQEKPVRAVHIAGRASVLLPRLAKTWNKSIIGVCVVAGPGSFSSVRAGVLQANLISRVLRIPLVGITVDQAYDLPVLSHLLFHSPFYILHSTSYVAPIYDKEPNITLP